MRDHPFPFLLKRIFNIKDKELHPYSHETEKEKLECNACRKTRSRQENNQKQQLHYFLKRHPEIL